MASVYIYYIYGTFSFFSLPEGEEGSNQGIESISGVIIEYILQHVGRQIDRLDR